jgi:hypothetical protein
MDDLSKLKASAGERHERDAANNPDLKDNAVPRDSAAQKNDSALGHLAAAVATDQVRDASLIMSTYLILTFLSRTERSCLRAPTHQRYDTRPVYPTRC